MTESNLILIRGKLVVTECETSSTCTYYDSDWNPTDETYESTHRVDVLGIELEGTSCAVPLGELIDRKMYKAAGYTSSYRRQNVTVRYHITDAPRSKEELDENMVCQVIGAGYAEWGHAWSDLTGYLWTDEKLVVGNHDVVAELWSYIGGKYFMGTQRPVKYLHMEIEVH